MEGELDIDQYRQKWEAEPHWEIKKEFLEQYKHDFPKTRLLCLAQAYVNVELLGCSYPTSVMAQIQELSRCLRRSKNFVGVSSSSDCVKTQGKRGAPNSDSLVATKIRKVETRNTAEVEKIENIQSAADSVVTNHTIDLPQASYLLDIVYSKSYDLISEIARTFKGMSGTQTQRRKIALSVIEGTAKSLCCKHLIQFCFEGKKKNYCKFFIGDTLIAVGCGEDESTSKSAAIHNSFNIFKLFWYLPHKSAENIMSEFVAFLRNSDDAVKILNTREKLDKYPQFDAHNCKTREFTLRDFRLFFSFVKCADNMLSNLTETRVLAKSNLERKLIHFQYFCHPDRVNKTNSHVFCHLVINNVLISSGSGAIKNDARVKAAKGFRYLLDFLKYVDKKNSLLLQPMSVKSRDKEPIRMDHNRVIKEEAPDEDVFRQRTAGVNVLNTDRLRQTYEMKFALFDRSKVLHKAHIMSPQEVLYHSASQSQAKISYKEERVASVNPGESESWRCSIFINDKMISSETASAKKEAKLKAADSALEKLKRTVCTIQEKEHTSTITHQQVDYAESISQCISSSNVGHQMLLKMGWKGGAIKSKGITEPVMAEQRRFGEGLGFSSGVQKIDHLKKKVESLLRDYQNSDTLSDLVFTSEFSKDERKVIHVVAMKNGLVSASRGKEPDRQLHVRRKLTLAVLLQLLVSNNGITEKYDIITVT